MNAAVVTPQGAASPAVSGPTEPAEPEVVLSPVRELKLDLACGQSCYGRWSLFLLSAGGPFLGPFLGRRDPTVGSRCPAASRFFFKDCLK